MNEIDQIVFRKMFLPDDAIPATSDLLFKRLVTDDLRYIAVGWVSRVVGESGTELEVVCTPYEQVKDMIRAEDPEPIDDSIIDRLYPIIGTVEGFLSNKGE